MLDKADTEGGTASGTLYWDDGSSIGESIVSESVNQRVSVLR